MPDTPMVVIVLGDALDVYTCPSFRQEFRETLDRMSESGGRIIVDLRQVAFIDGTGMGALVGRLSDAVKAGVECVLVIGDKTERMMAILKLQNTFHVFKDLDEARSATLTEGGQEK